MGIKFMITNRKKDQAGLSIIELLISVAIGMAVIAGSIQVVASSKRSFIDQDEVTFIQTNARYALDLISKDIRMAGYLGCATQNSVQTANSINNDAGGYISMHGLKGFEGGINTTSFPADFKANAKAGADAILVRHASDSGELDVSKHVAASATIHIHGEHNYPKGSTLMIADATCRNVGIFQVSGPNGLPANHLVHNTGGGTNNCTKIIKGQFVCTATCKAVSCGGYTAASGNYGPGSKVMAFAANAYYVSNSTVMPGMPALKRQVFNATGAPSTSAEEIALGVEDMELLYGVDTDGDGNVDQSRQADAMDLNGNGTITDDEWDKVLSVKVSLVFRSQMPTLPVKEKRTLAGTEYDDRYLRQVVNSTIRIRNRG
jgi:type IV pilus assembly protein PilW